MYFFVLSEIVGRDIKTAFIFRAVSDGKSFVSCPGYDAVDPLVPEREGAFDAAGTEYTEECGAVEPKGDEVAPADELVARAAVWCIIEYEDNDGSFEDAKTPP